MHFERMKVPPVSTEFYERLILAFPPIDPRRITPETSMIEIQRLAAQQEVIEFIKNAVPEAVLVSTTEPETTVKPTWTSRARAFLSKIWR